MHRISLRYFLIGLFVFGLLVSCSLSAATLESPEVHADHTITFRLSMPFAHKVEVNIDPGIVLPMTEDASGVWTATSQPMSPDIYGYSFVVDGTRIADPLNTHYKSNMLTASSLVEIPAETPEPWDETPIPHGVIHHYFYVSEAGQDQRDYYVYTPPGFDPRAKTQYPVLYLLHGFSDRANAWIDVGKANFILDSLIDEHKAMPMIVVMPLGYGVSTYAFRDSPNFSSPQLTQQNFDRFRESLLTEIVPRIENDYPILPGPQNHAIAGLSMGGSESLYTGLNHPEIFGWVGSFSMGGLFNGVNGSDYTRIFPGLQSTAAQRLLWIACGDSDGFLTGNRNLIAWLRSQGLHPIAIETPGAHDWTVWRRNLIDFLPLLFTEPSIGVRSKIEEK